MFLDPSVLLRDLIVEVSPDNHIRPHRLWNRLSTLLSVWTKRFVAFLGYGKEDAQGQAISSDSSIIDNDRSTRADEPTAKAAPASKQLIRFKK